MTVFYKRYSDFSLAHHDAARRFQRAYLTEIFSVDGQDYASALFDMRNGYFARVFANPVADPKVGAFVVAFMAKAAEGALQSVYYIDHQTAATGGGVTKEIPLSGVIAMIEKLAAQQDSTYKDVPCFDPEACAIPITETPRRRAVAVRERPEDVRLMNPVEVLKVITLNPYSRLAQTRRAALAQRSSL